MIVYTEHWRGCKFVGKNYPRKPQTLVPMQQTMMIPQYILDFFLYLNLQGFCICPIHLSNLRRLFGQTITWLEHSNISHNHTIRCLGAVSINASMHVLSPLHHFQPIKIYFKVFLYYSDLFKCHLWFNIKRTCNLEDKQLWKINNYCTRCYHRGIGH